MYSSRVKLPKRKLHVICCRKTFNYTQKVSVRAGCCLKKLQIENRENYGTKISFQRYLKIKISFFRML